MPGYRIDFSRVQQHDANSAPYSGGLLYVYTNNTTTPVTLYSDHNASSTAANPIVADSAGRLPVRYVGADDRLTLVFKTSAGVEVWSDNNFEPVPNIENSDLANYVARAGGNTYRMTGPFEEKEATALVAASTLDLDAMTGNWGHVTGNTGISTLSLANGSRRTLIFDGTPTLTHSANLLLGGANITAHAGLVLEFAGEGSGVTRLVGGMTATGKPVVETVVLAFAVGDETTAIATGTNKRQFRAPFAFAMNAIPRFSLATAQSSGANLVTLDLNIAGTTAISTKSTIDNNETSTTTAATPAVLNASHPDYSGGIISVADDALISIDIDNCDGSTAAKGVKGAIYGYRIVPG